MTGWKIEYVPATEVSTHMPLARHDKGMEAGKRILFVSTHMPLARHDELLLQYQTDKNVSTHMPLARHDHP